MTFVLVTLLPTGRSRVIKKFSSRSQSKTSWPPLDIILIYIQPRQWSYMKIWNRLNTFWDAYFLTWCARANTIIWSYR